MPSQADINAGLYLIQCLEVIVDPTTEALPIDFGTNIPLVTDPSSNFNARGLGDRNPLYKGVRRQVRRGGSGVQPTREQHAPLRARDNINSAEVGGSVVQSDVLLNDDYTGQPTITIISGPRLSGASASVSGNGNESLIDYTPPATGSGGQDSIRYRLRATGNRGSAIATLRINVTGTSPPPPPPSGSLTLTTLNAVGLINRDTWPYTAVGLTFNSTNTYQGPNAEASVTLFWLIESSGNPEEDQSLLDAVPGSSEYAMFIDDQWAVWSAITGDSIPPTTDTFIPSGGQTTITLDWLRSNAGAPTDYWTNDGIVYPVP